MFPKLICFVTDIKLCENVAVDAKILNINVPLVSHV